MKGVVLKSTGALCQVLGEDGHTWVCRMRGVFRNVKLKTTNPIAVGDRVEFEPEPNEDDKAIINFIEKRKNYIIRKSVNLSKEAQIVASNLDQAFLFVTLKMPRTSTGFVDRFLVTAEAYEVPTIIVFNKTDLHTEEDREDLKVWKNSYGSIGYQIMEICAEDGKGCDELYALMADKTTMLAGHSGVGKSTFINTVDPRIDIRTAEVSDSHNKGKHTTTFAEMHRLKNGGFIIDTPGIKGFGLIDIPKDELHHHFPEIFALLPDCKFHNCVHINEPGCAVRKAVENGKVPKSRYKNYSAMFSFDESETYRAGY